jgi:2-polyprenyl-3-methyl-5-hydroxy-6-metoxy-1,4-benzoquinol methylase
MSDKDHHAKIRASWDANAAAWTSAVRQKLIASRVAGTDAAIVDVCKRLQPSRVLDVGCGEGWLTRALADLACNVLGIDCSADLIVEARAAGGGNFDVLDYDTLARDSVRAAGPWDVILCNYVLFDDPVSPLLAALRSRLAPQGRVVIQTVHPWIAAADTYKPAWREEDFSDFGVPFAASMPWYFRTLESWSSELRDAGLVITRIEEPLNPETGRPLSLILECAANPIASPYADASSRFSPIPPAG